MGASSDHVFWVAFLPLPLALQCGCLGLTWRTWGPGLRLGLGLLGLEAHPAPRPRHKGQGL